MKFILAFCSLLVFSVSCSSPQEKLDKREAQAKEDYKDARVQAQEEYDEDKKQEAIDYIEDSEGAELDEDSGRIRVDE